MHDLGFAEALDSEKLHILGEAQWIKETEGCNSTGKSETRKLIIRYPSVDWSNGRNNRNFDNCNVGEEEDV